MKTYKKDYFLAYSIDTLREVLKKPVKIPFVPLTQSSELLIKDENDWLIKRSNGEGRPDTVVHAECSYDESQDILTVQMHSKRKGLTDTATVQLYYVGDFRTRVAVRYDIAYNMYKFSHIRQRFAVFYNGHRIYIDTFDAVIAAISAEAEQLLAE